MTKKFHILFTMLIIVFLGLSTNTYACGTKSTKTEKSCCKKEKSNKIEQKDCCKNHKSKNSKDDKDCDGKCKNVNCNCRTTHFAFTQDFVGASDLKSYFFEYTKITFPFYEITLSSGFHAVWTPPKIS